MSRILHKEMVGREKAIVLSKSNQVFLFTKRYDRFFSDTFEQGPLLATSSIGCRAMANALIRIAEVIDGIDPNGHPPSTKFKRFECVQPDFDEPMASDEGDK